MSESRLIRAELNYSTSLVGAGTEADPVRRVEEIWTDNGRLVASRDAMTGDSVVGAGFGLLTGELV